MDFHGTSYLGPRAFRLEQQIPLHKICSPLLPHWQVDNVLGDGRCGYRSIARYLGLSWQHVLQRLLAIMLKTNVFPSSHIIDLMSAQDNSSNACPTSCWLDSNRISLLAASCPDWFPHGFMLSNFMRIVIHIRADGSVDTDSTLSSRNAWLLGLLTASAPHFVHLRPSHKHAAKLSTLISKACFCFPMLVH